ncbi:MAG: hypothetical protein RL632_1175 [Bacteroidota bacterium]|jgi:hypothetical protein
MDERFEKLKEALSKEEWPSVYLFKFIVPNDSERIAKVNALFDEKSEVTMHPSRTDKYMSISAKELMLDVDSVMKVYEEAAKIPDLISL